MTPARPHTTRIDREQGVVTLINTFTVTPEQQPTFLDVQRGEYRRLQGQIAGALAANLHRGWSGRRVVNYARFRSMGEMLAWQSSDLMKQHRLVIEPHFERAAPALFHVAHVAASGEDAATIRVDATAVITVITVDPAALEEVLTLQRDAAEQLVRTVPGTRAIAIHRGATGPTGPRPGAGPDPGPRPSAALYALVEDEPAARALMAHDRYRAAFTTEHAHIRAIDSDLYTTFAVEPG